MALERREKMLRSSRILAQSCTNRKPSQAKRRAAPRPRGGQNRHIKIGTKQENELASQESQPLAAQRELARLIERFTGRDGPHSTQIAPLNLFRFSRPTAFLHSVFRPVVCLVAQGSKRMMLGDEMYVYDEAHFLLVTLDLPVASQVIKAAPRAPYLSLSLDIDTAQVGALVTEIKSARSVRGWPIDNCDYRFCPRLSAAISDPCMELTALSNISWKIVAASR